MQIIVSNAHTVVECTRELFFRWLYSTHIFYADENKLLFMFKTTKWWYLVRVGKTSGSRQRQYLQLHWLYCLLFFFSKKMKIKLSLQTRNVHLLFIVELKNNYQKLINIYEIRFVLTELCQTPWIHPFMHCSVGEIENEVNVFSTNFRSISCVNLSS